MIEDELLSKCLSKDDISYWIIEDVVHFIVNTFSVPSLHEVYDIQERIGSKKYNSYSSKYGFDTKEDAVKGLAILLDLAEKEGTFCYLNGHIIDESRIEFGHICGCKVCGSGIGWVCISGILNILCEYSEEDIYNDNCIHCGEPADRK